MKLQSMILILILLSNITAFGYENCSNCYKEHSQIENYNDQNFLENLKIVTALEKNINVNSFHKAIFLEKNYEDIKVFVLKEIIIKKNINPLLQLIETDVYFKSEFLSEITKDVAYFIEVYELNDKIQKMFDQMRAPYSCQVCKEFKRRTLASYLGSSAENYQTVKNQWAGHAYGHKPCQKCNGTGIIIVPAGTPGSTPYPYPNNNQAHKVCPDCGGTMLSNGGFFTPPKSLLYE